MKETEARIGSFALDVLATVVNSNKNVAIENQLETTDHDHLGKLLTYASGYNADVVVWLAKEMREEHRQALDWLNQRTDADTEFYGVVIEAFRIDNSRPAFRFDVVARPNQWRKVRVNAGRAISERGEAYRAFLQDLTDALREKYHFTKSRVAPSQSSHYFSSGISGISYEAGFAQGSRVNAGLYIDTPSQEGNKRLFDAMHDQRTKLEEAFGEGLEWERLDIYRASRIAIYRAGSIDDDEAVRQKHQEWLISRLLKLKEHILPHIATYI